MTEQPRTTCRTCVTPIAWIHCPTGGWWAHDAHPADEHDAVPAAWVDGDPLMEAIAATVWEHCRTEDTSLVVDDPRNIAATAAAVARAAVPAGQAPVTDRAEAVGSCPGRELDPNPCRCPCYGCKHHCAAHNPDDTNLTEADIDRMMAAGTPVQIMTGPPDTYGATPATDQTAPSCVCGEPTTPNTVHRADGPCFAVDSRLRVAALAIARTEAHEWADGERLEDKPLWQTYLAHADAVLSVLPASVNRAAVLREAADHVETLDPVEAALAGQHAWRDAAAELRRLAAPSAVVVRRATDETPGDGLRPCGECSHPKDAHTEGEDPVSPGRCADCPESGEEWHDYQPAATPPAGGAPQPKENRP